MTTESKAPMVSVVIPLYNSEKYIAEAVESAVNQTMRDHEIIVVDDGSTDGSREQLKPFLENIRYIHRENGGPAAARNTGVAAARGRYVAFLDCDDVWLPEMLARQTGFLEDHPEVGLAASVSLASEDGYFRSIGPEQAGPETAFRTLTSGDILLRSQFAPSGTVVRKSCLDAVGPFDETLSGAEDTDMWVRIGQRFGMVRMEEPLWRYRVHGGNLSTKLRRMEQAKTLLVAKAFRQPEFRRRLGLRLRVYGELYFERAFVSGRDEGHRFKALCWTVLSGLTWPGRLATQDPGNRLVRTRNVAYYCLGPAAYCGLSGWLRRVKGERAKKGAVDKQEGTS